MPAPTPAEIDTFVARLLDGQPHTRRDESLLRQIATWATVEQGYELDVEQVLDWDVVNGFVRHLATKYADSTARARRQDLRQLGKLLNPSWTEPYRRQSKPGTPRAEIYSEHEIEQILTWANSSPHRGTDLVSRQLIAALCLGAGLRPSEADLIRWQQIYIDSDRVFILDVNERDVPVLDRFAEPLYEKSSQSPHDFLVSPKRANRDRLTSEMCFNQTQVDFQISPAKMRNTRIAHFIETGSPERAVLAASGMSSFKGLTDFHPKQQDFDLASLRSYFHGGLHDER